MTLQSIRKSNEKARALFCRRGGTLEDCVTEIPVEKIITDKEYVKTLRTKGIRTILARTLTYKPL